MGYRRTLNEFVNASPFGDRLNRYAISIMGGYRVVCAEFVIASSVFTYYLFSRCSEDALTLFKGKCDNLPVCPGRSAFNWQNPSYAHLRNECSKGSRQVSGLLLLALTSDGSVLHAQLKKSWHWWVTNLQTPHITLSPILRSPRLMVSDSVFIHLARFLKQLFHPQFSKQPTNGYQGAISVTT